jgi:hypothetical protein
MIRSVPAHLSAVLTAALTTALVSAAVLGGSLPARAADSPVEYSEDGVTWSSTLPPALFDDDITLVPGDSVTESFHLRHTSSTPAVLDLSVSNASASSADAAQAFGVTVSKSSGDVPGQGGERHSIADLAGGSETTPRIIVDPGQEVTITVTVDLAPQVPDIVTQNSTIGLDLVVHFADAATTGGGAGDGDEPPAGGVDDPDDGGEGTEQVIPLFPTDSSGAGNTPSNTSQDTSSRDSTPRDGAVQSTGSPGDGGTLAITGVQRGMMVLTAAVLVLGALLFTVGRHRRSRS